MKKLLFSILILVTLSTIYLKRDDIHQFMDSGAAIAQQHQQPVVIYSTTWCKYCDKAKEFMQAQGIEYFEYNIEESPKGYDQYRDLNGRGTPLLLVKGQVIRGFDPQGILTALRDS